MWRAVVLLSVFLSLIDSGSCSCDITRHAHEEVTTLQRGRIQQYAKELFYYRNGNPGNCIYLFIRSMDRNSDKIIPEDVCCFQQRFTMQSRSTSYHQQAITSNSFGRKKVDLAGSHEALLQTSSANSLSHQTITGTADVVLPAVYHVSTLHPAVVCSKTKASPALATSARRMLSISKSYSQRSSSIVSSYSVSARHACANAHSSPYPLLSSSQSLSVFAKSISTSAATSPFPSIIVPPFPQPPNQNNENSDSIKAPKSVSASNYFMPPAILPEDLPSSLIIPKQAHGLPLNTLRGSLPRFSVSFLSTPTPVATKRDMPAQDTASLHALSKTNHFVPSMQGNQPPDRQHRIRITTALPPNQPPFVLASPKFQSTAIQYHSPLPEKSYSHRITSIFASPQPLSASVQSYNTQSPMPSSENFHSLERKSSRDPRSWKYRSSFLSHIPHAHGPSSEAVSAILDIPSSQSMQATSVTIPRSLLSHSQWQHKHKSSLHSASPSTANAFPKNILPGQFQDPFSAFPPATHSKDASANLAGSVSSPHSLAPPSVPRKWARRAVPVSLPPMVEGNIPLGSSIPPSAQRKPEGRHAGVVMQPRTQVPMAAPPSTIPSRHHRKRRKKPTTASPMVVGPPPAQDCSTLTCVEPLTNTPLASPCGCVLPMQVGILLGVEAYAFFPLVSELAAEIAAGTYLKQSQVRIMGANADNEYQEKTYVNVNLVPLEEKFDTTTALLTYERFWQKKVILNATLFGDYQVTFVHYPGLPPSPPSPFVNGNLNGGNSSGTNNEDPLGVDIRKRSEKLGGGTIAAVALSSSVAVVICLGAVCFMILKCRNQSKPAPAVVPTFTSSLTKRSGGGSILSSSMASSMSLSFVSSMATYTGSAKLFTLAELEKATDNFSSRNILGEGGFGRVYRGVLEDGTKLAVKVLRRDDQQGGREFMAEVEMLSRLHHRNLVKLIGICTEEHNRSLVYELIPNGSVESHLHDKDKETAPLDWDARMKIALGAARGLAYLHEDSNPRVIHRDFKASNILLEDDFTPKVSDFGLAKVASDEGKGYISTRVMGTFGYVAPEYAMTGHLLVKSDVYSYGVVLLELLSGRKPVDMSQPPGQENLVTWARPLLTTKEGLEMLVDPSLNGSFSFDNMARVAAIASMCVQPEVSHRPFMGEVVQALKLVYNDSDTSNGGGSQNYSQEEDAPSSDNELKEDSDQRWWRSSQYVPDGTSFVTIDYDSGPLHAQDLDTDRPLSASALLSSSGRFVREPSGSFRRHSSSGPLRTSRNKPWYRSRGLTGGSMSEHGLTSHFGTGLDTNAHELWH